MSTQSSPEFYRGTFKANFYQEELHECIFQRVYLYQIFISLLTKLILYRSLRLYLPCVTLHLLLVAMLSAIDAFGLCSQHFSLTILNSFQLQRYIISCYDSFSDSRIWLYTMNNGGLRKRSLTRLLLHLQVVLQQYSCKSPSIPQKQRRGLVTSWWLHSIFEQPTNVWAPNWISTIFRFFTSSRYNVLTCL